LKIRTKVSKTISYKPPTVFHPLKLLKTGCEKGHGCAVAAGEFLKCNSPVLVISVYQITSIYFPARLSVSLGRDTEMPVKKRGRTRLFQRPAYIPPNQGARYIRPPLQKCFELTGSPFAIQRNAHLETCASR
jgi:hypothetical protein